MSDGILPSFLGAVQASLAVLLTISYGVVASRLSILKEGSSRDISKMCVRLFLPALLITNVGAELHADTAIRYVPVLIWALIYTLLSMALGWVLKRAFKFPAWTVAAICFNNTTALPLLLIQSLNAAGILSDLTMGKDDSSSAALGRAKSYFLVSAMIGNSLTFAIGPKLLDDEESPDKHHKDSKDHNTQNGADSNQEDEESARRRREEEYDNPTNSAGRTAEGEEEYDNETTSLLPDSIARHASRYRQQVSEEGERYWVKLPKRVQVFLGFLDGFLNAPLIGAVLGALIGLVAPVHRLFFSSPENGGYFNAWLTQSVKNVGELFPALQLVVVGAKLSSSLLKMKKGEASGSVPWIPMLSIFFIRFIMWPAISIGTIFLVADKTNWLEKDPVLWFVLMLMPTGPPATKLVALADVSGANEDEKMSIAKFLAISYAISPIICLAVVGSLKASLAVSA